jgi:hypothetical protein
MSLSGMQPIRDPTLAARKTGFGRAAEAVREGVSRPNPDLFVGVLWKRLVGDLVLNATVLVNSKEDASEDVRAYAHCGRAIGTVAVVTVNVSPKAFVFTSELFRLGGTRWTLTGPDGVFSKSVDLNGRALTSVSDAVSANGAALGPSTP